MQPRYSSVMVAFISAGAIQLLVGPASAGSTEQMNVRSSTRATSDGSVRAQNELGRFTGSSGTSVPAATSSAVSRSHSSSRAVAPHDAVGGGQLGDLADPVEQPAVAGGGGIANIDRRSPAKAVISSSSWSTLTRSCGFQTSD